MITAMVFLAGCSSDVNSDYSTVSYVSEEETTSIAIGTSSEDFWGIQYEEIVLLLNEKGFSNIVEKQEVIEFDPDIDLMCKEIAVEGNNEFSSTDEFNSTAEIVITYYVGAMAKLPDGSSNLLGIHYKDVEKQFKDAGFTNTECVASIIEDSNAVDGSVVNIVVGSETNNLFEQGEEWYTNTKVRIDYQIIPTPTPKPTAAPTPAPTAKPTAAPTPAPTPAPTAEPQPAPQAVPNGNSGSSSGGSVTVPDHEETGPNLVWVPVNGGKKYHSSSSCSNMKEPMQVTIDTAVANGYTACKRCH